MIAAAVIIMVLASLSDLRTHSISIISVLLLMPLALTYAVCFKSGGLFAGLCMCAAFCFLSLAASGRFGIGDALCMGALSLFMGVRGTVFILSAAIVFAVVYELIRYVLNKRDKEIPLIPFITAGFICSLIP